MKYDVEKARGPCRREDHQDYIRPSESVSPRQGQHYSSDTSHVTSSKHNSIITVFIFYTKLTDSVLPCDVMSVSGRPVKNVIYQVEERTLLKHIVTLFKAISSTTSSFASIIRHQIIPGAGIKSTAWVSGQLEFRYW